MKGEDFIGTGRQDSGYFRREPIRSDDDDDEDEPRVKAGAGDELARSAERKKYRRFRKQGQSPAKQRER